MNSVENLHELEPGRKGQTQLGQTRQARAIDFDFNSSQTSIRQFEDRSKLKQHLHQQSPLDTSNFSARKPAVADSKRQKRQVTTYSGSVVVTSEDTQNKLARKKRLLEEQEKLRKVNKKLEEVRRRQRVKHVLQQELIAKGASAQSAESYIMSLEKADLTRYTDQSLPDDNNRFAR